MQSEQQLYEKATEVVALVRRNGQPPAAMMLIRNVSLSAFPTRGRYQVRSQGTDEKEARKYAEKMVFRQKQFPPIIVVRDTTGNPDRYEVLDGHHRLMAKRFIAERFAEQQRKRRSKRIDPLEEVYGWNAVTKVPTIDVVVIEDTFTDSEKFVMAHGANDDNGVALAKNAGKLLFPHYMRTSQAKEGPKYKSAVQLAKHFCVDRETIKRWMLEHHPYIWHEHYAKQNPNKEHPSRSPKDLNNTIEEEMQMTLESLKTEHTAMIERFEDAARCVRAMDIVGAKAILATIKAENQRLDQVLPKLLIQQHEEISK